MSVPTQTCEVCGDVEVVTLHGRGFPPDAAARRLAKRCTAKGHRSKPTYLAGVQFPPPAPPAPTAGAEPGTPQ